MTATLHILLDQAADTIARGGFVMPPLLAATALLWYALGWRFVGLFRGATGSLPKLVARARAGQLADRGVLGRSVNAAVAAVDGLRHPARPHLDEALGPIQRDLSRGDTLIKAIVGAAPLAGLLGTVSGMVATFDALGDMALFAQSGGIAGGISQALVSTEMGLVVAIPGLVAGGLLARKQRVLENELDKLKDLLCAEHASQRIGGGGGEMN